jgi:hypothetical protein
LFFLMSVLSIECWLKEANLKQSLPFVQSTSTCILIDTIPIELISVFLRSNSNIIKLLSTLTAVKVGDNWDFNSMSNFAFSPSCNNSRRTMSSQKALYMTWNSYVDEHGLQALSCASNNILCWMKSDDTISMNNNKEM